MPWEATAEAEHTSLPFGLLRVYLSTTWPQTSVTAEVTAPCPGKSALGRSVEKNPSGWAECLVKAVDQSHWLQSRERRWLSFVALPQQRCSVGMACFVWECHRTGLHKGQERRLQDVYWKPATSAWKAVNPKSILLGKCLKCYDVYSGYQG